MYDDYLDQIANAKTFTQGNSITDGRYLWLVKQILVEKKHKGVMFIAEMKCIESAPVTIDPKLAEKGEDLSLIKPVGVGESASYIVNLNNGDSAFSNVKSYMLGIDGSDPKSVNPVEFRNMLDAARSAAQPFRGAYVRSESYRKPIKNPKSADRTIFMGHNWMFVPQTPEEIAARRAQLDADSKK